MRQREERCVSTGVPDERARVGSSPCADATHAARRRLDFVHGRGAILTLSCYPGRALTELGDLNLVFPSIREESVAQTRAFSGLYLATVASTVPLAVLLRRLTHRRRPRPQACG